MEIDYKNFKMDCSLIIEPFLQSFQYQKDLPKSGNYINFYSNEYNIIVFSLVDNFPHIDLSWHFRDLNSKEIPFKSINDIVSIDQHDKMKFYRKFASSHDMTKYSTQMHYAIAIIDKFYKGLLTHSF